MNEGAAHVQLGRREPLPRPEELAAALRAASQRMGHRPAVTVLTPYGRAEQGFASLAQWAAKGAHLLETDHAAGPDSRVLVSGPAGWMPAAVAVAAWWVGATVVTSETADVAVLHETAAGGGEQDPGLETLWFGDAVDGSPADGWPRPVYAVEVQAFPDHPPRPRAGADLVALGTPAGRWTQGELIDEARDRWGGDGVLGVDLADDPTPDVWLTAVAVRPLVTGQATVVVRGVERGAADGERVGRWVSPGQRK